jgi:5'-3' exonuclease
VSSKYISELNVKGNVNNQDTYDENSIILQVKNYVDDLLLNVECDLVYIALDGVPTFSKILEQKKRRFIGDLIEQLVKEYTLPFSFNKSLISPGTKFMRKISEYLNNEKFPTKTIISDTDDTGEGEFKILDYI